jgi:hypothetical protein
MRQIKLLLDVKYRTNQKCKFFLFFFYKNTFKKIIFLPNINNSKNLFILCFVDDPPSVSEVTYFEKAISLNYVKKETSLRRIESLKIDLK